MIIDISLVDNVLVDGIDWNDYPDFCDAFISSADYNGKEMSEELIDKLNDEYPDFVYEQVVNAIY
jgi:hypothetical protein